MLRFFCATLLTVGLLSPSWAEAKERGRRNDATIERIGLPSCDAVFAKVSAIDERLTRARRMLGESKRELTEALMLGRDSSLQDALAELKARAGGQLKVTMEGPLPRLESKSQAPAELQASIDAVNAMIEGIGTSIVELRGIPAEAAGLATKAAKIPKQFKADAKAAGMKPTQIPAKLKILKSNIEITAAIPEKAKSVVERMNDLVSTVGTLAQ
jgi:hypothetical protein